MSPSHPESRPQRGPSHDWRFIVRALRARNFRLFFSGQSVSLIGTWMTRLATAWLVYRLTRSAFLLGLVSFAGQIPMFFLAPVAGVLVDRWDRHRTLVVTQALSMVQSLVLAALALNKVITVHEILWLSLFQGIVNAFDMPARQAFVVQMIDRREDLANAIALNSSMVNATRLIGPAIAGVIVAAVGEGYCFLIDGISYMAVIMSLLLMRLPAPKLAVEQQHIWAGLKQGWSYVSRFAPIRSVLLLVALISLVGMPYTVLMPIFAGQVLGGGAHVLGFLMSASGLGAFAGAAYLAARKSVLGLGRIIARSAAIFGAALVGFGISHQLWLSLLLMLASGLGMMTQMAASNTLLQTIVEEDKRGRVMSFYAMAFQGMVPFGSLLAGALAARVGAPVTVVACGALCLGGTAWFVSQLAQIRAEVRPIYVELGIIPAVATGIQAASARPTEN
jgi:MFS family permease